MKTDKKIYTEGKWRKCWIQNGYYAFWLNDKTMYLHSYLYQAYHRCSILPGVDVHHKDEDKLNNHPRNLELKYHGKHSSEHKFKGGSICWYKRNKKWSVRVYKNEKRIHIGFFDTQEEAQETWNNYYRVDEN